MDRKQVVEMLRSGEPDRQREGAWAAGEMGLQEAVADLALLLGEDNLGVQEAADFALRKIGGKDAVDALIPLLRLDQPSVRNLAMDILRELGRQDVRALVDLLRDSDSDIRIFAADILGSSGRASAVSALGYALLGDSEVNVRYQAAVSLGELGSHEAVESLCRALKEDNDEWVQFAVVEALLKIGDSSAVDAMVGAFGKTSELVSSVIVDALGTMGDVKAVPLLLKHLDSSSPTLRNKILKALIGLMGEMFFSFLPEERKKSFRDFLVAALDDEDPDIQDAAIKGLAFFKENVGLEKIFHIVASLSPEAEPERRELLISLLAKIGFWPSAYEQALNEGSEEMSLVVIESIGLIGDEEGIDLLVRHFDSFSRDAQRVASKALSRVALPRHEAFFVSLLKGDPDADVVKDALYFLGDRMAFAGAADLAISFLDHRFDDVKEAALNACIAIGTEKIVQKMLEMAKDSDPVQRLLGFYGLGRLEPQKYQDVFEVGIKDVSPDVRRVAIDFLSRTASNAEEILPMVASCLQDESKDVRLTVIEILQRSPLVAADDYLVQALRDRDNWVKMRAIEALGERKVVSAVPQLLPLLDDPFQLVPLKVVKALGAIQDCQAVKVLMGLLDTSDEELRSVVVSVLENMQRECKGDAQW